MGGAPTGYLKCSQLSQVSLPGRREERRREEEEEEKEEEKERDVCVAMEAACFT